MLTRITTVAALALAAAGLLSSPAAAARSAVSGFFPVPGCVEHSEHLTGLILRLDLLDKCGIPVTVKPLVTNTRINPCVALIPGNPRTVRYTSDNGLPPRFVDLAMHCLPIGPHPGGGAAG